MNATLVIAIIQAILRHGPSAVHTISDAMSVGDITPEQIDELFIHKEPEDYFSSGGE